MDSDHQMSPCLSPSLTQWHHLLHVFPLPKERGCNVRFAGGDVLIVLAKVKRVTKSRAGTALVFPTCQHCSFPTLHLLLQGVSDLQASQSGIFRHCGASTAPLHLPFPHSQDGGNPTQHQSRAEPGAQRVKLHGCSLRVRASSCL